MKTSGNDPVMSLEAFNGLFSGGRVCKEGDIKNVEAPTQHHTKFKVTYMDGHVEYLDAPPKAPDTSPQAGQPEAQASPAEKPVYEMSWEEIMDKYDSHPEMKKIDAMEGLSTKRRLQLRMDTREQLFLDDLLAVLPPEDKLSDELKKKPFVMRAYKADEEEGEDIKSKSVLQMERAKAFKLYAPANELLDQIIGEWPTQSKRNYPAAGWKPLKEKEKIDKENTMDTDKEDTGYGEEQFAQGVMDKMTPDAIAGAFVKRWQKLNDDAVRAAMAIKEKNLAPGFSSGKSPEELEKLLGKDLYALIDRVVRESPERLRLNEKAEAMKRGEKVSWF